MSALLLSRGWRLRLVCGWISMVPGLGGAAVGFAAEAVPDAAAAIGAPADVADAGDASDGGGKLAETTREDPAAQLFWEAMLLLGSDRKDEQKRGRERLREAADREYSVAQYELAECFSHGAAGFDRNDRRAVEWFRLAADRGHSLARIRLGIAYAGGVGVRRDFKQALRWLDLGLANAGSYREAAPPEWYFARRPEETAPASAASSGPQPAEVLFALAHCLAGLLCDEAKKPAEALVHYEAAAFWGPQGRAGNAMAAGRAAMAYAYGRGTARDLDKANALLERRRDILRDAGRVSLRWAWWHNEVDDFGFEQVNKAVAVEAERNLANDRWALADALFRDAPEGALKWCELAADSGESWAMLKLGEWYSSGPAGARDPAKAFQWFKRAAEETDAGLAWGNLAACYKTGYGTPADPAAAAAITKKRAWTNSVCGLVEAGQTPKDSLSHAEWRKLLVAQSKGPKALPIASYFIGIERLHEEATSGRGVSKETIRMLEHALTGGVAEAAYELGRYWNNVRRDPEKSRAILEQGMDGGSFQCAVWLGDTHLNRSAGRDLAKAERYYLRALEIDPGDADAHNALAMVYEKQADSLKADPAARTKACETMLRRLEEAERLGSANAACNLGRAYYDGVHAPRDFRAAYLHFQLAADRGHTGSKRQLGVMHQQGQGVPVTPKDALHYFRLAAADGDRTSLREVCRYYLTGDGVEPDAKRAAYWLLELARMGDTSALVTYSDLLLKQEEYAEARKVADLLAASDDPALAGAGCERLSRIFAEGLGVKPDHRRADDYFKKALAADDPAALCRQARTLVASGNHKEVLPLLDRALAKRSAEAAYLLGSLYLDGNGVAKDEGKGWQLLREAVRGGDFEAMVSLALATLDGRAGAADLDTALRYAETAEKAGHPKAKAVREQLEAKRAKPDAEDSTRVRSA